VASGSSITTWRCEGLSREDDALRGRNVVLPRSEEGGGGSGEGYREALTSPLEKHRNDYLTHCKCTCRPAMRMLVLKSSTNLLINM
jgi:hypothetical protein